MAAKCIGPGHHREYEIALLNHLISLEKSWCLVKLLHEVKGGENVMKCFKALCGQIKVTSLMEVIPDLDAEFVNQQCDWTTAAHWAI